MKTIELDDIKMLLRVKVRPFVENNTLLQTLMDEGLTELQATDISEYMKAMNSLIK